eukprot:Tbor_TRINITY_DN3550_c0_g1::TRINITY_DN3550_c0_g1_i1::g.2861::m.2861/K16531/BBS4; Bardet-Biedl syndrome 4 protein
MSPFTESVSSSSVIRERRNWLIHLLYVRHDFKECLAIIEEQLKESQGMCEYALLAKALICRGNGELQESLALFQAAAMISPMNINNLKQVGRGLFLLGRYKQAIDIFNDTSDDSDWELHHLIGMCYMYLKDYDNAEVLFKKANSIQQHDKTYLQLGKLYTIQEKFEKAISIYLEAQEFSPENPVLLTTIGLLYLRIGENFRAFEFLGNSLTLDPTDPRTILAAGSIIQDHQDYDVALSKYRVAAVHSPNSAQLWNNIGMSFFGKQNYIAAISCLRKALHLAPFEWIVAYNLGLVFMQTEQYASAFHYFSSSINLKPDFAASYIYIGVSLNYLNDFENACSAYEKGILMESDHIFHFNYCIMLINNNKIDKAKEQYKAFSDIWDQLSEKDRDSDRDVGRVLCDVQRRLGISPTRDKGNKGIKKS